MRPAQAGSGGLDAIVEIVKRHTHQGLYAMTRFAGPDPAHDCDVIPSFSGGIHVRAKDSRGYPDGDYEAEWLIGADGGTVQIDES